MLLFGLTNALSTFERVVNSVFHDMIDIYALVYSDSILVYSEKPLSMKNIYGLY